MKKLNVPGRSLGKAEQKMIIGGTYSQCLIVGEPCTDNHQCCSGNCEWAGNGYLCGYPIETEEVEP